MVSFVQRVVVASALLLQLVQSISMWTLDRLGPHHDRSVEDDVSLIADVVHVLHHHGESRFGTSADHKLIEGKVRKLMWMAQCLKDASGQKQHMDDARFRMMKKPAFLETMSHAGDANNLLLDSRSLSHLSQMVYTPKYPFDPLMDDDFITDANNYLEDFINASDIPKKLKDKYTTTSTTTSTTTKNASALANTTTTIQKVGQKANSSNSPTSNVTTTSVPNVSKTPMPKVTTTRATNVTTPAPTPAPRVELNATNVTKKPHVTTPAPKKMSLLGGARCTTRSDSRSERRWQFLFGLNTAAPGTPCLFGVVPADEGSHCVLSHGKYGSFGWCYTRSDRAEWGSCSQDCPLVGPVDVIAKRLDRLTLRVQLALNKLGIAKCNRTHVF